MLILAICFMMSFFFFARLTFLTGLFFAASWALLLFRHELNPDLVSTILTIGFGIGSVLLPAFGISCLWLAWRGSLKQSQVPRWLIIANLTWLLVFIIFIIYLNGPSYYQP